MSDTKRPSMEVIKTSITTELDLPARHLHHLAAESQRRGISVSELVAEYGMQAVQDHEDRQAAEALGISVDEYRRQKPKPVEAKKPNLRAV